MVKAQCTYCKRFFELKGESYRKEHNFCSRECYHKYQSEFLRGKNNKNSVDKNTYFCANCGKQILELESQVKSKKNIFCSKECRFAYDSKTFKGKGNPNYKRGNIKIKCLYCGKKFERPAYQKGRAKYCSKECKNKYLSEVLSKTPEYQKRLRQQGIKAMKSQKNKFTKPERIVYEYLQENNIYSIPQHPMFNRFVVDFFIPSFNMVIEVLGDYWHGNPLKYSDSQLRAKQLKNREKDKIKYDFLTANGYEVHMIWENDIYKKLKETMNFIIK